MTKYTEKHLTDLLAEKHSDDIFVRQCKTGGIYSKVGILDAWVLKKTWSPKTTIGYEIKVSRSDFMSDEKWPQYLPYCNQFYFVCPAGTIDKRELPNDCGLISLTRTGTKFITKKKAPHRNITIPEDMLFYIIMCRVKITESQYGYKYQNFNPKQYWENWLRNRQLDREFGGMVGKQIRKTIKERIDEVAWKNRDLRQENESLQHVKKDLEKLEEAGINRWKLSRVARNGLGDVFSDELKSLNHRLNKLKQSIDSVQDEIGSEIENAGNGTHRTNPK